MKFFMFVLLMVFVASCDSPPVNDLHLLDKGTLVDQVTNETFLQLKNEKELYPFGTGSGMMDQIRMLALSFLYYKEVDVEHARELLMAAGRTLLDNINNNEQIRPFLHNFPFQPENIQIRIFFKKPDGSRPDSNELAVAGMIKGILDYDIINPETGRLKTIYEEKFDEAAGF